MNLITVQYLLPELILIVTAAVVYMAGTAARRGSSFARTGTVVGIIIAGVVLCFAPRAEVPGFVATELALYVRWLTLLAGLGITLLGMETREDLPEYLGSLLVAMVGAMLIAGTDDLVLLFIGLEAVSIPTYLLIFLGRRNDASAEATAKYFFLSILATALVAYGLSFVYGIAGTTDISKTADIVYHTAGRTLPRVSAIEEMAKTTLFFRFIPPAIALLVAGIGFKAAIVPFHFYAPDVYQGSTNQTAAYLSVIPKIAAIVALIRLIMMIDPVTWQVAWRVFFFISILTMTYANIVALWQNHLRRLMAYSSIAHMGYLLIGLSVAVGTASNSSEIYPPVASMLFYLTFYSVATIGVFALLEHLSTEKVRIENIEQLAGLGRARPKSAAAMGIMLLSLTGIPPLVGFWGKFVLFASAIYAKPLGMAERSWLIILATAGAINAAIGATYYLKIIGTMYFRMPLAVPERVRRPALLTVIVACVMVVVAVGCYPGPLLSAAKWATKTLF